MKKNEDLQKDVRDAIKWEMLLNAKENNVSANVGKHFKKFIYLTGLVGIGLFFNSCMPGYVGSEPSYVESTRPSRPSNLHVWVDGDWAYSRQTHAYVHNDGYWSKPRQGRTFVSGHWQESSRGHSWTSGRWQKQGRQENNNRR